MTRPRYLTKSRYRMACECPTQLFYTKKKAYKDNGLDDPFFENLRDGGFQVGELARQYYGKGVLIGNLGEKKALMDCCELDTLTAIMLLQEPDGIKDAAQKT